MKYKLALVAGVVIVPWMVEAGELTYGMEGHGQTAYGYTDIKKHHHGVGKSNLDTHVGYEFDENNSVELHADLMLGIDKELKDYNQGDWGEEVYGIADTIYGQLMVGQVYNVASLFHNGAPTTGILNSNSDVVNFLHNPNWKRNEKETSFATLTSTDINTDGVAAKINYISPEFYGTAVGFSWTPDSYNRRGLENKHAGYAHKDGFATAIYSDHRMGNINSKTSLGYAQYHGNDKEFSISQSLNRGNWTLGAGYRKTYIDGDDKSKPDRILPFDFDGYREGYAWNVGLEYEIGPFSSALSYFKSKQKGKDNQNDVVVWSNEYQFNKYVDVYLAAAGINYRFNGEKDKGVAGIIGIGVNF